MVQSYQLEWLLVYKIYVKIWCCFIYKYYIYFVIKLYEMYLMNHSLWRYGQKSKQFQLSLEFWWLGFLLAGVAPLKLGSAGEPQPPPKVAYKLGSRCGYLRSTRWKLKVVLVRLVSSAMRNQLLRYTFRLSGGMFQLLNLMYFGSGFKVQASSCMKFSSRETPSMTWRASPQRLQQGDYRLRRNDIFC